jgi:group II intron reverse transcriptase/maturase
VQEPNILLAMLSKMAQKPEVKFDKLYQKLYNAELWLMAYEQIAPHPGNMTRGVDGKTIDGMGMERIDKMIARLKSSKYKPQPVRRKYIPKTHGQRAIGIPSAEDKHLQTVVKLILEAIYEPLFAETSHGFRPGKSCHTALEQVKKMDGVRWWIEGDVRGFFDNLHHETMLRILAKRITDKRFLHLIEQFLKAGYIENWQYKETYSGVPQGGNLSPVLSNIYLNELDQAMAAKTEAFNKGKRRRRPKEYMRIENQKVRAKKEAQKSGDWRIYKDLTQQQLRTPATENFDPDFRRLYYVRYADDVQIGIIGSKAEAKETKTWLKEYLAQELKLELSDEKTRITNAKERVRFLGYDIKRWRGQKKVTYQMKGKQVTRRTTTYKLVLLMPRDKCEAFAKRYGTPQNWYGKGRLELQNLSELEILMIYNAEIRGFTNYYALATNLTKIGHNLLRMTTMSFFHTIARKRRQRIQQVARSLRKGRGKYAVELEKADGTQREYELVSSTKQLRREKITYEPIDEKPKTWQYRNRSELGQRLRAEQCEWCGTREGKMEVHHVRKLKDLKGRLEWEKLMIARRRKTMVLCKQCHIDLHAGRLRAAKKIRESWRAGHLETCKSGSEGRAVKPDMLPY